MDNNGLPLRSMQIKTPDGLKLINTKNILYVKAERKCSVVYFTEQYDIITYHMLNWFEDHLSSPCFFRCHNSYIVNCQYVDRYNNKEIILTAGKRIPLSRKMIWSFKENLEHFQEELI